MKTDFFLHIKFMLRFRFQFMSRLVICFLIKIIISSTLNANQLSIANGGKNPTINPIESRDNENHLLDHLLLINNRNNFNSNKGEIFNFLDQLKSKKNKLKSDEKFLEYVFFEVQGKYLKVFEPLTDFSQIFQEGKYNCLTATTFYAIILGHFNFQYDMIELPNHIFLKVALDQQFILIESTDPLGGFIKDSNEIKAHMTAYKTAIKEPITIKISLVEPIDFYQLIGLHYFNLAIKSFRFDNFKKSYIAINKALHFNKSPKLSSFLNFLLENTKFTPLEKALLMEKYELS